MKKRSLILTLVAIMCLTIAGCGTKEKEVNITFAGSSTLSGFVTTMSNQFMEDNKNVKIAVSTGGSGAGVKSAIEKTANFGMASREVADDEKSKIKDYKEFMFGFDALTVSVNPENKLLEVKETLTTEEIQKIFSGEYKYWDELDKSLPHEEIVVIVRDIGGGAHKVFQKAIMGDTKVREDAIQAPSMGALVEKVISNKNAIGYASVGIVNQNEGKIKPMSIDTIEPSTENILNGDYKLSRPLLVIKSGELNETEQKLIDYMKSDKGIKTLKELGFVANEKSE